MSTSNNASSISLQLESLTTEYDNVLLQYKQAAQQYMYDMNNNALTTVNNTVFWGSGTAGKQPVYTTANSANSCQALCQSTKGCSGATFRVSNGMNQCYLRSGDGTVIPSGPNDTAIVSVAKQSLENLQILNQQLIDLNQQIVNIITTSGNAVYTVDETERAVKNRELTQNYAELVSERNMIKKKIDYIQNLEQEQYNGELNTNTNYFSYVLLLLLAIVIILILVKLSFGGNSSSNLQYGGSLNVKSYYIIGGIFLLIIVIYYYNN
jgi:hypothetical protein